MAEGFLNPRDEVNTSIIRPAHVLTAVGERRWAKDGMILYGQDLNAIMAQFRTAMDAFGLTDTEGSDDVLQQLLELMFLKTGGTMTGSLFIQPGSGVATSFQIIGEGVNPSQYIIQYRDSGLPILQLRKARGTLAAPTQVLDGNVLGRIDFAGYAGDATWDLAAYLQVVAKENFETGANGVDVAFHIAPVGGTTTEFMRMSHEDGLELLENTVIDTDRIFRTRTYTVGTLPTASPAGKLASVSDESSAQTQVYSDGTYWRRHSDNQVASASIDGTGINKRFTTRAEPGLQELVKQAMSRFRTAQNLQSRIYGLWVFGIHNSADALAANFKAPGTLPLAYAGLAAAPAFTAYQGFKSTIAVGDILTASQAWTAFGATQDSISTGVYIRTPATAKNAVLGKNTAANRNMIMQIGNSGTLTTRLTVTADDSFTPSGYDGLFTMVRPDSTQYHVYRNRTLEQTHVRASNGGPTGLASFLGTNDNSGTEVSDAQIGMAFIGAGTLNITNVRSLYDIFVEGFLKVAPLITPFDWGVYTPSLTNTANISASTAYQCQWSRIGNVVTVSGRVDVDVTTVSTLTQLGISLPVASDIVAAGEVAGTAATATTPQDNAAIIGDTANDRAVMTWYATDTANNARYFTFQYKVNS